MATLGNIKENKYLNNWVEKANADNAAATATKAAAAGQTHYITGVAASFSATASALLQIKDGSTVIFEQVVYDHVEIKFDTPLKGTSGNAVSAVLAASGTAGTIGYVNLIGFTV